MYCLTLYAIFTSDIRRYRYGRLQVNHLRVHAVLPLLKHCVVSKAIQHPLLVLVVVVVDDVDVVVDDDGDVVVVVECCCCC